MQVHLGMTHDYGIDYLWGSDIVKTEYLLYRLPGIIYETRRLVYYICIRFLCWRRSAPCLSKIPKRN